MAFCIRTCPVCGGIPHIVENRNNPGRELRLSCCGVNGEPGPDIACAFEYWNLIVGPDYPSWVLTVNDVMEKIKIVEEDA